MAENEEESPWEPLSVEHGHSKEDNVISVWFPHCYTQHSTYATDDKGILATIISNLNPGRFGTLGIQMTPVHAQEMAKHGWTKASMKKYIVENAKAPWRNMSGYYTGRNKERSPDEMVPIFAGNPNQPPPIQIFVAGGQGAWTGLHSGGSTPCTAKIDLPKNWDNLVAKYKKVVPSYVRY
jgi:hypothetical protein